MFALRSIMTIVVLLSLVSISLVAFSATGIAADSEYSMEVDDVIEAPDRTITLDGDEYEINSVVARDAGGSISIEVTVPDDESFRIDLYNSERQVEDFELSDGEGDQTVTFETGSLDPGTYMLGLLIDSDYQTVQPVIINGYDIDITLPEEAEPNEDIEITAEVTKTDSDSVPDSVEAVIWNDSETITQTLTYQGGTTYEGITSIDTEGDYQELVISLSV